jgi:hypothetical protein
MERGIDASANCISIAKTLLKSGRSFVCRYYANFGSKRLTTTEARTLSQAGLRIVTVWEDGRPTDASYFSFAKGVDDGTSAYHDALLLNQPEGSVIYFAVDFDPRPDDISGVVADYFRGLADGFDTIGQGQPQYIIGVYGSGATCLALREGGLAQYSWLAMSTGWRGYNFSAWNIKQGVGKKIGKIPVDYDEATDDYGGFTIE